MTIGEKIKKLRRDKDVTQEKIAAYLNISSQAVSKWENNTAAPDLSLIVPIANFFGVTTDVLFDRDSEAQKKEIEEFEKEGLRLANLGLVREQIPHWRKAVLKYPNNYKCLISLAYALFRTENSGGFDKDETVKCVGEAIEICERILEDCTENDHRASATQILVMAFGDVSGAFYDEAKAVKYASESTSIYCSSDVLLPAAYGYRTEKAKIQNHYNNLTFIDLLSQNIVLAKYRDVEEEIFALKTMLGIWDVLLYDGNYLFYHCRIKQIYRHLAMKYARLNDEVNVCACLEQAKNTL